MTAPVSIGKIPCIIEKSEVWEFTITRSNCWTTQRYNTVELVNVLLSQEEWDTNIMKPELLKVQEYIRSLFNRAMEQK
jgi:hypothetical protein